MNRNVESHFALNPTSLDMSRSKFDRSHSVKTSFNVGNIIPFYVEEILPGDTFSVDTSKVVRMQTLKTPIMDNLYLDTYYFFVPNRLVWKHWKEFNGENTQSAWIPSSTYSVPQITAPSGGWQRGTIADYMGLPVGVGNISVNALPIRAFALVMNEWFRDENLMQPLLIPDDDTTVVGSNGSTYVSDVAKGGMPYLASKYHDYFTSCLPAPQKGPDVPLPLGDYAGVYTGATNYPFTEFPKDGNNRAYGLYLASSTNGSGASHVRPLYVNGSSRLIQDDSDPDHVVGTSDPTNFYPANLYADLSNATGTSINQLRLAFQIQKLYEKDARGGTRYIEILKSHFGVTSPDARQQRPEYLGGNRIPINIMQITQQSESGTTPQGTNVGMSLTTDKNSDFTKSFTEHGFIIGCCVARYDHTYQQGIERLWSRKTRFDYYWPVLANIGEQAVLNKEIYAQGSSVLNPSTGKPYDEEVFGYQEAWADYRYKPNHVTGMMRSSAGTSLDTWHLADDYASMPTLSDGWIREDLTNVDRVLAINHSTADQLFVDMFIKASATRCMPVYSVPGLIDHH